MVGELVFIGIGLYGLKGLTLEAINHLKTADVVFIESYTSIVPGLNIEELIKMTKKDVKIVSRNILENLSGRPLLEEALREKKVVLLTPGDPFIATTHISLRLTAHKMGIKTRVINAPSVLTAIFGATGLQVYKIGRIVTITFPYPEYNFYPYSSIEKICENIKHGLHTIALLDLKVEEDRAMTVAEAAELLLKLGSQVCDEILDNNTPIIVLARLGSDTELILTRRLGEVLNLNIGPPPHTLVIPGELHPLEIAALECFAHADRKVLESWNLKIKNLKRKH